MKKLRGVMIYLKNFKYLFILVGVICNLKAENLDSSFGTDKNGIVSSNLIANYNAIINSTAIQTDGKIVAAGYSFPINSSNSNQFTLARYNNDGTLDTSFGVAGIVTTTIFNSSQINSVVIQADGKIVAAGYCKDSSNMITIARYNSDGSLDTNFNSAGQTPGVVTTTIGSDSFAQAVKIDSSNNIIIAGSAIIDSILNIAIARYTPQGVLDTTFNGAGSLPGTITVGVGNYSSVNALAIDGSGKIVIGGMGQGSSSTQFALLRYNADGSIDNSFGTSGSVVTQIGRNSRINALAIDSSNNIVVCGLSNNGSDAITLARYTSAGVLDTTFNSSGDVPGIIIQQLGVRSSANAVEVDDSDNIVVSGYSNSGADQFFVARYDSSGDLDSTFQDNGIGLVTIGTNAQAYTLNIVPSINGQNNEGKILVGGYEVDSTSGNMFFSLVRFNKDNTTFISVTNIENLSTVTRKFLDFKGISSGNNSTVNVYLDNALFSSITTDGSGNWSTALTTSLAEGTHLVRTDLLSGTDVVVSAGLNFTVDTSMVSSFSCGATTRVDSVFGDDSTGVRNGAPFKTITAALSNVQSGDTVWVFPGIYNETINNMPAGITIRGIARNQCVIQQLNISQDTDLITMNENCSLECLRFNLTSNNHVQMRGVVFPGTTSVTSRILECNLTVSNATASTNGTSNVYGIHSTGTGFPGTFVQASVFSFVLVSSVGSGNKRGILIDQPNGFRTFQSVISCNSIGGTGPVISVETNHASAQYVGVESIIRGFSVAGPYADISQTLGSITLSGSNLITMTANGKPFNLVQYPKNFIFADSGAIGSTTTYLRPGTATASASEVQLRVSQIMVVKALSIRLANAPGVGNSVTWTLRKNGVNTGITLTISDASTSGLFNTASVNFQAGDLLSISQVPSGANAASDVMAVIDFI